MARRKKGILGLGGNPRIDSVGNDVVETAAAHAELLKIGVLEPHIGEAELTRELAPQARCPLR
jgi:hypothetical protein